MSVSDYTNLTAEESAANGAHLLDTVKPDWYQTVNFVTLNQSSFRNCVLGQNFGDYDHGLRKVGAPGPKNRDHWAHDHGFDRIYDYGASTEAWKNEINKRIRTDEQYAQLAEFAKEFPAYAPQADSAESVDGPLVSTNNINETADIIRKWIDGAVRVGRNGSEGEHTASGMTYELLKELGLLP